MPIFSNTDNSWSPYLHQILAIIYSVWSKKNCLKPQITCPRSSLQSQSGWSSFGFLVCAFILVKNRCSCFTDIIHNETDIRTPLTEKNPLSSILRAPLVLEDNSSRRAVFFPFNPTGKEFNQRPWESFEIKTIALQHWNEQYFWVVQPSLGLKVVISRLRGKSRMWFWYRCVSTRLLWEMLSRGWVQFRLSFQGGLHF